MLRLPYPFFLCVCAEYYSCIFLSAVEDDDEEEEGPSFDQQQNDCVQCCRVKCRFVRQREGWRIYYSASPQRRWRRVFEKSSRRPLRSSCGRSIDPHTHDSHAPRHNIKHHHGVGRELHANTSRRVKRWRRSRSDIASTASHVLRRPIQPVGCVVDGSNARLRRRLRLTTAVVAVVYHRSNKWPLLSSFSSSTQSNAITESVSNEEAIVQQSSASSSSSISQRRRHPRRRRPVKRLDFFNFLFYQTLN